MKTNDNFNWMVTFLYFFSKTFKYKCTVYIINIYVFELDSISIQWIKYYNVYTSW